MSNLKQAVNKGRVAMISAATVAMVALVGGVASAATPDPMSDIVDDVTGNVQSGITENLPAILGVAGFILVVFVVWGMVRSFIGRR